MYDEFQIGILICLILVIFITTFFLSDDKVDCGVILLFLVASTIIILYEIEYLLYWSLVRQEDIIFPAPLNIEQITLEESTSRDEIRAVENVPETRRQIETRKVPNESPEMGKVHNMDLHGRFWGSK